MHCAYRADEPDEGREINAEAADLPVIGVGLQNFNWAGRQSPNAPPEYQAVIALLLPGHKECF